MMKALTPLKKHRAKVFLAPGLKAIECTCELIIPFLVRAIIDDGLSPSGAHYGEAGYVLGLCGIVFGLSVLGFLFTMVTQYVASRVCTDYAFDLKNEIYRHYGALTPAQLENYGKSKALNLINASSLSLQTGVQMFMRLLVRAPYLVVGSVVAAFLVNVYAGFVVLGSLALSALVIGVVVAKTPKEYTALMNDLDALAVSGDDAIAGARVVKAFNKQEDTAKQFQVRSSAYRKQATVLARINAFINPLTFGLVNLAVVGILALGSFAYETTGISVGSIVAIVSFLTQSLNALIQFTRLVTSFSKAYADKKRVDAFFAIVPAVQDGDLVEEPTSFQHLYELRGASLSFGGEGYALSDIDFHVDEGESIGIIGGTGSGKSTLLGLLLRFNDVSLGQAYFHDHDIKQSQLHNLRHDVALVSQKPQLFAGSIRENLTLGRKYGNEEIRRALKDALAEDIVKGKYGGLDAAVEENGANFSGGQKQRLLIARALLSGRKVLMLDDATSALDYKSDAMVRANIKKRENTTLILVSQRATSVQGCDRIYVLEHGKVVGVGRHEELMSSCDVYREIYQAQVSQQ